jgi:hypothetical protein
VAEDVGGEDRGEAAVIVWGADSDEAAARL